MINLVKNNKKMYYLYHIPHKKVGMTCNIYNRVIKEQGYNQNEFDILFSSDNMEEVAAKEIYYQKLFGFKQDLNSYEDVINSNINKIKSNEIMQLNVTDQTVTFPVPLNKLKGALMDNLGIEFSTQYGNYKVTPDLVMKLVKNGRESMFDHNRCYVYNKVLDVITKEFTAPFKEEVPNVYDLIRLWADERGIYANGDPKTQFIKLMEEAGELGKAILKKDKEEFIDAIGDMMVVLTNLAALENLKVEDCVVSAYNEIKDRKGSMKNGTFVKEDKPCPITGSNYTEVLCGTADITALNTTTL